MGKLNPKSSLNKVVIGLLVGLLTAPAPVLGDDISNGSYSTTDGGNTGAPPNGWPGGMNPAQVEPTARSNMGATARWWERANSKLSTTGAAGAYALTPSNASYPTAYTQGEVMCGKANFTSVGNDTLNYNGLGAKPIYRPGPGALIKIGANELLNGQQFCAAYDAALNSAAGGFQLLSGFSTGPTALSKTISVVVTGGSNFISLTVPNGSSAGCKIQLATGITGGGGDGYTSSFRTFNVTVGQYSSAYNYAIAGDAEAGATVNSATLQVSLSIQGYTGVSGQLQLVVTPTVTGAQAGLITGAPIYYEIKCDGNVTVTPLI